MMFNLFLHSVYDCDADFQVLTLYYVVAVRAVRTSIRNRDRSHKEGQPSDSNSATRTRPLPGSNFVVAIRVFETK